MNHVDEESMMVLSFVLSLNNNLMFDTSISKSAVKISNREQEVLKLIAYEFTSKQIAEVLFLSRYTVDSHRKNLMEKWNVKNTAGLVRVGFQLGVLSTGY